MSRIASIFDVNFSYIVNEDFNDFKSFLNFPNNSVHVDVHVTVDNYLYRKLYNHNFQSKPECNSNKFYPISFKHDRD